MSLMKYDYMKFDYNKKIYNQMIELINKIYFLLYCIQFNKEL